MLFPRKQGCPLFFLIFVPCNLLVSWACIGWLLCDQPHRKRLHVFVLECGVRVSICLGSCRIDKMKNKRAQRNTHRLSDIHTDCQTYTLCLFEHPTPKSGTTRSQSGPTKVLRVAAMRYTGFSQERACIVHLNVFYTGRMRTVFGNQSATG